MIRQLTIAVLIMCSMSALSAFAGTWSDGFEHPDLGEWKVHLQVGNQPVWKIENGFLLADQSGASCVWIGDDTWEDYSVEVTVILLEERPPGPDIPDSRGAGIAMYFRVAPHQGYGYGIYTRLWDGRGSRVLVSIGDGFGPFIASEHKALKVDFGREYKLRMTEKEDIIKCYLDGKLALELAMDKRFTSGVVGLWISNVRAHFDDVVVTGANIPDGGPGLGKAVKPQARLATTWAYIKHR